MYGDAARATTPVIWVLVADSKAAKLYQYRREMRAVFLKGSRKHLAFGERNADELMPLPDGILGGARARKPDAPFREDRRDLHYGSYGDLDEERKRRFVRNLAFGLDEAWRHSIFDYLVLAAPAKMLGELRKQLTPAVQDRIAAVLPKDLVACEPHNLAEYLQDTLAEARSTRR